MKKEKKDRRRTILIHMLRICGKLQIISDNSSNRKLGDKKTKRKVVQNKRIKKVKVVHNKRMGKEKDKIKIENNHLF